jgi:hypothetical protein
VFYVKAVKPAAFLLCWPKERKQTDRGDERLEAITLLIQHDVIAASASQ